MNSYLRAGFGLLLSLGILECGLRTKLPNRLLPQPSPYYSEATLLRDRTLDAFKQKHGEPEVVVIGSSVAYTNVDAGKLGELIEKRAFGLGLPALAPGSVEQYWRNHWRPKVQSAKTVILVLRARDILPDYIPTNDAKLMGARIERGWIEPKDRSILDYPSFPNLRLKDYYGALSKSISAERKPLVGISFWNDEFGSQPQSGMLSEESVAKGKLGARYMDLGQDNPITRTNWLEIIQNIRDQVDGRFIVVYSQDFTGAWKSERSASQWRENILNRLQEAKIETIVPMSGQPEFWTNRTNYQDVAHLHKDGMARFTEALASELKKRGI